MVENIQNNSSVLLSFESHTKVSTKISQVYPQRKRRIQLGSFGYSQNHSQFTPTKTSAVIHTHKMLTSVLCKDGKVPVSRCVEPSHNEKTECSDKKQVRMFLIYYRIFRPASMSSRQAAPLIILHGGPGIPSNYLYPVVDFLPSRSVIFFDQLGCGRSDAPMKRNMYSIEHAVNDLETLLQQLGIECFHLYGHSFGGIIAFEYLKRVTERETSSEHKGEKSQCLSVILSSSPSSIPIVDRDSKNLLNKLLEEDDDQSTLACRFHKKHKCRSDTLPLPLADAYANKGKIWCSTSDIADYVAEPLIDESACSALPPALILRGEHDFVSETCMEGWFSALNHDNITTKTLGNCSHHALLEDGSIYGALMNNFISENE
jgi:proline iminopeptidase